MRSCRGIFVPRVQAALKMCITSLLRMTKSSASSTMQQNRQPARRLILDRGGSRAADISLDPILRQAAAQSLGLWRQAQDRSDEYQSAHHLH
jgi:hypothetical protein